MRFARSRALVLLLSLTVVVPAMAAPRESDSPVMDRAITRVIRAMKKVFGLVTMGDELIPPIPAPKP
jgi:hypothetical protein